MQTHFILLLLPLVLLQVFQSGTSLPCEATFIKTPTLNDTIQPNTTLFSIDGFIDFVNCTIKDYFEVQNSSFVLKKPFTDYCGKLECRVSCSTGIPGAKPENPNLNLVIERFANYTIEFSQPSYQINVTETVPIGTYVFDQGFDVPIRECKTGTLPVSTMVREFKLLNNSGDMFEWKPATSNNGLLVKRDVDYETVQNVNLILQASLTYQQNVLSTAETTLEILIQDTDDTPPKFEHDVYTVDIQEENSTVINKTLAIRPSQIHAFDQDRGIDEEMIYSIAVGPSGLFAIDSSTGDVHVTSILDREDTHYHGTYTVVIKASQKDKAYSSATATLIVTVTDIDDHLPEFRPDNYTATLSEHSATGSYIAQVTAVDSDQGAHAQFTYKLSSDSIPVDIDGSSGILHVKDHNELDREKYGDTIQVQVIAFTYDNKTGKNSATVTIDLKDINDNNPSFGKSIYHFSVANITGTGVIGKVFATDRDQGPNSNVTYSFMAGTQTQTGCKNNQQSFPFKVDALSGEIVLVSSPPLFCSKYSCFIRGCDNPVDTNSRRCTLSEMVISSSTTQNRTGVTYINETFAMFENMGKDEIVGLLRCTGSKYIYSGDSQFYVSDQGLLMTKDSLDREHKDEHEGVVKVEDSNGDVSCQVSIKVTVRDTNDHAPKFDKDVYNFDIPDDFVSANMIGNVMAVDDDIGANADILYSIKPYGDFDIFTLDTSTGALYFSSLSKLTKDVYQLLVSATDNGSPQLESVASVYIMKSTGENHTVPLSTPLSVAIINEQKHRLESEMSQILKVSVAISRVETAIRNQDQNTKSVVYIAAKRNDSTLVAKSDLQRVLLINYEAIRALFYQDTHEATDSSSNKGLRAPEIALIVMAAVILIGAVVAIIIISKQFNSHKKYRRLYENLTRNSSIYESQEIKVNMDDETSDYNGSLNTQELERTSSDHAVACINPLFDANLVSENDSGNVSDVNQDVDGITHQTRTNSEQALESLAKLSDMLDKEDGGPKLAGDMDVLNSEPVYTNLVLESEAQDSKIVSNKATDNNTINTNSGTEEPVSQEDKNDGIISNLTEQTQAHKNISKEDEPNPDYDVKQVRFNAEVLDTDDNKFEPLKENEEGRRLAKRLIDHDHTTSKDAVDNDIVDDMQTETRSLEQTNDEPGWVEEEINIPNTSVNIDSVGNSELNIGHEVSTYF